MIDQSEAWRTSARRSGGKAAVTWLGGVRRLLDPLWWVSFALIAGWAVMAAGTIAGFGELPLGGRGRVHRRPVAEEILTIAPPAAIPGEAASVAASR